MILRKIISMFAGLALWGFSASSQTLVDSVTIAKASSETAHSLAGSSVTGTNATNGKSYRASTTGGYFSYVMKVDSVAQNELRCTYWGSDAGSRDFNIYLDGILVSNQVLNNNSAGNLINITYSLPFALTRHKSAVTIKFQAKASNIAGGLYGIFTYKSATPGSSWPGGVHDPSSIIKCGNKYWIFSTGDGIYTQYSTDLITWTAGPSPFAKWGFPSWISSYAYTSTASFEGNFWAPDIIYMNGLYYLYYSCSIWGTMSSCIGVVVNKTLEPSDPAYKWVDQGYLGISYSSGVNAIDPAVVRGGDGKIWLTYGSFNLNGIMVTQVDSTTGKPTGTKTSIANSWTGGTNYGEGEGSCLIYHSGYYYLFYNKGGCCNGIASSYYIVMGRSTNPTGPYVDKTGKAMRIAGATSGGSLFFQHDATRGLKDRYYGPGHLAYMKENGNEYVSFHYYDPNGYYPSAAANYMGGPTLGIGLINWGTDGWPSISFDFLPEGKYAIKSKSNNLYWDLYGSDVSSTKLVQNYEAIVKTQQWDFQSLGTGEYKIVNEANSTLALEVAGTTHATNNGSLLQMATFTDSIYQKFRAFKSPNGEVVIYPSRASRIVEIPYASSAANVQLGIYDQNTCYCQRWYARQIVDSLQFSPDTVYFASDYAGTKTVSIQTTTDWTMASADTSWMTVSAYSGFGLKNITIGVDNYTGIIPRTGLLTVTATGMAPKNVVVVQYPPSTMFVSPDTFTINEMAQDLLANITSNNNWTLTNPNSWVSLSQAAGSGNGSVTLSVTANNTGNTRQGVVTLAAVNQEPKYIVINQSPSPTMIVSMDTLKFGALDTAAVSFQITSNISWAITNSEPSWATLNRISGTNSGIIKVHAANNTTESIRYANLTITTSYFDPINVTIVQYPTSLIVSPDTITLKATDTIAQSVDILANSSWKISKSAAWVTVSDTMGTGNKTIQLKVSENTLVGTRSTTIKVIGEVTKLLIVSQYGKVTGVNTSMDDPLKVYPNPVASGVTVECKTPALLQILNTKGVIIDSKNIGHSPAYVDLTGLPSGVYIIKMVNEEGTVLRKVIKN